VQLTPSLTLSKVSPFAIAIASIAIDMVHILSFLPFLALLLGKVVHASNGAPLIGAAPPPPALEPPRTDTGE
jgi:hypothetical protein